MGYQSAAIKPKEFDIMKEPKICTIPLINTGTHETFVIVVDGIPQSVDSWNFMEDKKGNRTFYLTGITNWQLHFKEGTSVQVIR